MKNKKFLPLVILVGVVALLGIPESADRPKWSALDNRMLRCTVSTDVRDWRDALACR